MGKLMGRGQSEGFIESQVDFNALGTFRFGSDANFSRVSRIAMTTSSLELVTNR